VTPIWPTLGQGRFRNRQTDQAKDAFLTIQRQVIQIFGDQHMREQASGRDALVDHMGGHWGLDRSP